MNNIDSRIDEYITNNNNNLISIEIREIKRSINDNDIENSNFVKILNALTELKSLCLKSNEYYNYDNFYGKIINIINIINVKKEYAEKIIELYYNGTKKISNQKMKALIGDFSFYKKRIPEYTLNKLFKERDTEKKLRNLIITEYMLFSILGNYYCDDKQFKIISNEYMELFCSSLFKDKQEIIKINKETLFFICKTMELNADYDSEYVKKFKAVYIEKLL